MKILLFILLKIVEVSGVIFLPYYVGKFIKKKDTVFYDDADPQGKWFAWLIGFIVVGGGITISILLVYSVYRFFLLNWSWVSQILGVV